jgi:3-hydroxyisobutyrate dehydrogenase-like beta-hydroxyacid dehydrogenase
MQSAGKLGWIGLGNRGSLIAKRPRNLGYPLAVYNRDRAKIEALA